eukprot:3939696-Rhodomonas_salina.1
MALQGKGTEGLTRWCEGSGCWSTRHASPPLVEVVLGNHPNSALQVCANSRSGTFHDDDDDAARHDLQCSSLCEMAQSCVADVWNGTELMCGMRGRRRCEAWRGSTDDSAPSSRPPRSMPRDERAWSRAGLRQ